MVSTPLSFSRWHGPAYQSSIVSKVTEVSSMEQHLGVTLWVRVRNLHIGIKHVYSVRPGPRTFLNTGSHAGNSESKTI